MSLHRLMESQHLSEDDAVMLMTGVHICMADLELGEALAGALPLMPALTEKDPVMRDLWQFVREVNDGAESEEPRNGADARSNAGV